MRQPATEGNGRELLACTGALTLCTDWCCHHLVDLLLAFAETATSPPLPQALINTQTQRPRVIILGPDTEGWFVLDVNCCGHPLNFCTLSSTPDYFGWVWINKQAKGCVQVSRYIQNISYCSIQLLYLRGKKNQATGSNKVEKELIRHIQMSELLTAHSMEHCFRCFVKGHEVSILRVYIHTFHHAKKHTNPWEIFDVSTGLHLKELLGAVWHYGNPHLSL